MARPLTAELIRVRTKSDNLQYVKKFTLCGNDIDDVKILRQMPNIEVLSLSVNKINSLKEFANCPRLQELYVRSNNISDLSDVQYLKNLPDLKILWLCENPCANQEYYREYVINTLPNLTNLDKIPVTYEERVAASRLNIHLPEPDDENDSPPSRNSYYENNTPKYNERKSTPQNYNRYHEPVSSAYQEVNEFPHYERENVPSSRGSHRNNSSPVKDNKRNIAQLQNQNTPPSLKNENVISAILMLLKDLDDSGLKIVKKDVERRLSK